MVALLVQNMERLDEQVKEEADGIHNTLGKKTYTKMGKLSHYSTTKNIIMHKSALYNVVSLHPVPRFGSILIQ